MGRVETVLGGTGMEERGSWARRPENRGEGGTSGQVLRSLGQSSMCVDQFVEGKNFRE